MNEHDSERLSGLFVGEGMEPTTTLEEADIVVFNTCCIRENADNRLYGELGRLKEVIDRKPGMTVAVGGCLAQKDRELIRERVPYVDVVFGTHNLLRATELLRRSATEGPITEILDGPDPDAPPDHLAAPPLREVAYAAWITIQTGCDNSCAFCIVPSVRGGEISRSPEDIVSEVEGLARRGVIEVTLLGQNVNSYGRDLTRRAPLFADLLRAVGAVEGIERVRFTSPHPKDIRPETVAAMAETEAVCPQLHLPLQSGSDRILVAMRRGYNADRYLSRLYAARAGVPDLAVTTDIIVGFPGETEEDFEATLEVAAEAQYDSAYTFKFSPRPGTRAADMADSFVEESVVAERFERLRTVVERSALLKHEARIGMTERVLVEGPSRKDPAVLSGRTPQGKLAHFAPPQSQPVLMAGSLADVVVTGAAPHHLRAEVVGLAQPPRYPSRIPVSIR